MRKPHKQIGVFVFLIGVALVVAGITFFADRGLPVVVNIGWVTLVIGVGVIASAKGISPLWCLFGPVGLIAVAVKRDEFPEEDA